MKNFTTEDVYQIMNTALGKKEYHTLDIEAKRKIVTECFIDYFLYQLTKLQAKCNKNTKEFSLMELYTLIEDRIPKTERMNVLSPPIHCLLSIISGLQGFEIIWEIDDQVEGVSIVTDESGRFKTFITSSHPNMSKAFKEAYQFFMNSLILDSQSRSYNLSKENKEK